MLCTTVSFCMSMCSSWSPAYSKNSHSTPMVMEKLNATTAMNAGESANVKRRLRLKMSTSAKPTAAQRKPLTVCSMVSQPGTSR